MIHDEIIAINQLPQKHKELVMSLGRERAATSAAIGARVGWCGRRGRAVRVVERGARGVRRSTTTL